MSSRRATTAAWIVGALCVGAIALLALGRWVFAIALDGPVLYGEGAVVHAALLSRDGLEYTTFGPRGPLFVAANYPPLYLHIAALGDPFIAGRVASLIATLAVASAIAWRARAAGALVSGMLALSWLATLPVSVWGVAIKPDLVALALTVGGVLALGARRQSALAGLLLSLASFAKPSALLPLGALALWLLWADRRALARFVAGGVLGVVVTWPLHAGGEKAMYRHIVDWNALSWNADQLVALVLVAVLVLGGTAAIVALRRAATGATAAYLIGALCIVALGGRDGASINYLLDLSAALCLALSSVAPVLRRSMLLPVALVIQAAVTVALFNPLGVFPGRPPTTGAWGDPARIAAMRDVPGKVFAEDSGLLLATGREPSVDDLFLWSSLLRRGGSFSEGEAVLTAVDRVAFDAVVSEVDLTTLDEAGAFERQRWHPRLVAIVLDRYRFDRDVAGLHVYVPKSR